MKRYLPLFITVVCAFAFVENLKAQNKSSKVSIKALQLKSSITSDGEDNFEYRLNTWFNGTINQNCVDFDNQPKNTWLDIKAEDQQRVTNGSVSDISTALNFETEGWEEDGCGGDCGYHTSCSGADEGQCGRGLPSVDIIPYNMVPGNYTSWPNLNTYNFCGTNYQVKYLITYSPPTPNAPTVKVNGTTLTSGSALTCDDPFIELTTSIYIRPDFLSHVNYTWEYRINNETYTYSVPNPDYCGDHPSCSGGGGGSGPIQQLRQAKGESILVEAPIDGQPLPCCYESPYISQTDPRWRTVPGGTTNANNSSGLKSFNLRSLPGLQNITVNSRVVFRVTATANGLSSPISSSSFQVNISPQSPKATTITYDPSCPGNVGTGVVYVSGVTSQFSSYKYILKKGDVASISCHPDTNGSCLSADDISGSASGSSFVVNNVKAQTYTLFLLNNAGTDGFCPRRIDVFTVPSIPDLGVNPISLQDLTCNGVNEGSIQVSIYNGRPAAITYDLLNLTTNNSYTQSSNTANASVVLDKLDPGSYRLTVSDNCTPAVVRNFDITQPVKVTSSDFQYTNATCTDPGNGTAKIIVTKSAGTFDRSVSSIYTYQLYKDGVLYNELDLNANTYTWSSLPVSTNYRVVVKEKGGADCNAAIVNFAIAGPDPIGLQTPVVGDVTCYGGTDGKITVNGTGGTGSYAYELSGPTSSSNTTGEFLSLPAGDYTVTVRNTITCNDKYISAVIPVKQPTEVVAVISKKDISCFGLTDGEITSVVSGGTPGTSGYNYTWETKIGTSWSQLSSSSNKLVNLSDGTYRLKAKDDKECPATSNEVVINEPAAVGISGVQVSDIKCSGETGTIAITGTGGTGQYTFGYSLNNGSFTDFNSSTPLSAGIYQVRIVDANGCSYKDTDNYTITTPSQKLSFTETLSDYNGYNISCFGGGNGSATLSASGGNGANYTGYEYGLDNGLFQQDAMLTGIYAGDHILKVKDGRGCIVSKPITFTQTTAQLTPVLVEKKDVTCFGDATGILDFTGSGGLSPYEYSLDNSAFQDQGRYTGLSVGDHTIIIKDKNGCDNTATSSIVTINPKIEIATAVTDVSCFGGNDGSVATSITGGVSPFQYRWTTSTSTASTATALATGNYTVTVTDNAGCKMEASAFVQQPLQSLSVNLATIPVCYRRSNGSITVTVKGGTEPYEYSIDNGLSFQSSPVFIAGVGNYTITSKDSKGCTTSASTDIVLRNDKPEPNFLVASTRSAMDTLVIIDVSVPKPDSIYWIFDPQAIVISSDQWSPQLRFLDAGTYFLSMTGYFGGCDYSVTKNMTVTPYDPSIEDEKLPGYKPIQSVMVTPNPSNGTFEVSVKLVKKYNLSIVVYDVLGTRHYDNTWNSIEELKQAITLNNASSGVYLLRVITESDAQDVRIMINK